MRICKIEGCDNKYLAKGLCKKHYNKKYRINNKENLLRYNKQYHQNNREKILEQMKQRHQEHKEQDRQYREDNKEHIAKYMKQHYFENKDTYAKNAKRYNIKRMKKYRLDKEENLKIGIRHSKFLSKKYKEDGTWQKKQRWKNKKQQLKRQNISLKTASMRYTQWTKEEINYLRQNRKKKTQLKMSIELDRTYHAIGMALYRFHLGRKTRILQGKYYE